MVQSYQINIINERGIHGYMGSDIAGWISKMRDGRIGYKTCIAME
jgi:hypothetical protein